MSNSQCTVLEVAVGVVMNQQQQIFITKRPDTVHQGGLWEFPGGKREAGETRFQALQRELQEEIGITVEKATPLITIPYDYGDTQVCLDVWQVTEFTGTAHGKEGQPGQWVGLADLGKYAFPAANRPILRALVLPDVYAITNNTLERLPEKIQQALQAGVRLFQLRVAASYADLASVVQQVLPAIHAAGGQCLINREINWVEPLGLDGVHLSSQQLLACSERPLPDSFWVGASCHDWQELQLAQRLGVDFAVLSPVLPSQSHPQARPLGWDQFAALVKRLSIPVYALGGMTPLHVSVARLHGGQGIAGIRGLGF